MPGIVKTSPGFLFVYCFRSPGEMSSISSDNTTTLEDLKNVVAEFVAERDWQQFHSPKNISMAMAIEAAELMEHFQWISMQASREIVSEPDKVQAVSEEISDVLCYLLAISNELGIDLASSLQNKMIKNRLKYPAEEYQGRYGPEDV